MSKRTQSILIVVGLLAYLLWQAQSTVVPADVPIRVTYVYEASSTAIPPGVEVAFNKLNRQEDRKIIARLLEDPTDSGGPVAEEDKVPLAAAKEAGLPAIVVVVNGAAVKVVKNPTTEQQVMESLP